MNNTPANLINKHHDQLSDLRECPRNARALVEHKSHALCTSGTHHQHIAWTPSEPVHLHEHISRLHTRVGVLLVPQVNLPWTHAHNLEHLWHASPAHRLDTL